MPNNIKNSDLHIDADDKEEGNNRKNERMFARAEHFLNSNQAKTPELAWRMSIDAERNIDCCNSLKKRQKSR